MVFNLLFSSKPDNVIIDISLFTQCSATLIIFLELPDEDIIILGNGGSNAISCHLAEDYTKALLPPLPKIIIS